MSTWSHRYKPAAAARTHMLLAALMWSAVGTCLLAAGTWWSRSARPPTIVLLLVLAAGVGLVKAHLVLRKSAARIADRIRERGDGRCLGGFVSWRTWIMIGLMMMLGRLLRAGILPLRLTAFIYEAVGAALLIASFELWQPVIQWNTPTERSEIRGP